MSGIYIPGMEMPKTGYEDVRIFADGSVTATSHKPPYYRTDYRAVRVPDHGRLIDADALQSYTIKQQSNDYNIEAVPRNWAYAFCAFEEIVVYAPTIIPGEEVDNG